MQTELEAKFHPFSKETARWMLEQAGGKLIRKEFLQKRYVFDLPKGSPLSKSKSWARVRDEGGKVTMSLKSDDGKNEVDSVKELQVEVNNFETTRQFLLNLGCEEKAYQESYREIWELDGAEVTIDEWPYLEPFIEIEAESEQLLNRVCEKLQLDFSQAQFGAVDSLYAKKYKLDKDVINTKTPVIKFNMPENPFNGKS